MIDLKALTPRRLKLTLIALPMVVAVFYFAFVASDTYVSVSTVALQEAGTDSGLTLPGGALLAGLGQASHEESHYLREYLRSLALLKQIDSKMKLREHYASPRLDLARGLNRSASQEDFLDYYRGRVVVTMDDSSSTLTLHVQGFDPEFAQHLNQALLDEGERFINEMSHKAAREKLGFVESELGHAGERLQQARAEMLAFQAKHRLLDPTLQAKSSGMIVAELQASITKSEADLRALRSYLNEDSFQVKALRNQIDAMRAQMDEERTRSTGEGKRGDRVGALAIEFEGLKTKSEFAADAYKLALTAVENARIEATRKLTNFVVIEPPTRPETAEYPRRLYNLASLLIACLLLYGIVRLVLATIREHQD